jgi:ABC-type ATPase involved in cell division
MTDATAEKLEPTLATAPAAVPEPVPTVALQGVEVRHGALVPALARLDLALRQGEWLAVEGPVAAGKSTLLRLVAGRETPTAGAVRIAGEDLAGLHRAARLHLRRSVGVMAPDLPLFPREDAVTNVALVEWLAGAARDEAQERALTALAKVGLEPGRCKGDPCGALSTGEQHLVGLARALARRPALLVLDDLVGGLDAAHAARVLGVVEGFCEAGVTVVSSARGAEPGQVTGAWPARVRRMFLRDGVVQQ